MKKVSLYPADIYQVIDKSLCGEHDKLVLNMLYMPLIGITSVSLYLKLLSEVPNFSYISSEQTHHHLITSMSLTLEALKEARLKLEGIGLMKTYYMSRDLNYYIYELYSPLSASEFLSHPIFNVVLYNNVGKSEYTKITEFFKHPKISLKDYEDITVSFDGVFKSSKYTMMEINCEDLYKKNKLLLNYDFDYDFDLIVSSIPKDMFNEKCLNKANRELIVNLSFLYEIDPINMADLIRASLNEKGNIERDELRRNAKKYYQFNNDNRLPSLLFKSQPEYLKNAEGDNSKRGKIINVFENTSPYEFLRAKYKGAKPTSRDMSILEELLIDVKLNPAVINVLIDYVLRTNNNKLVKSYVDTIAGQWKRSNIETALEAMQIAEKEHKKKYKKSSVSEVKKKKETVPAWFNEKIESSSDYENNAEFNSFLEEFRK